MDREKQESLMQIAMEEATLAADGGNSPFGAVLTDIDGNIVARACNTTSSDLDPTAHAEINLIRKTCHELGRKDLSSFILISNAQSCAMCFSAAVKAGIKNFIYGYAEDSTLTPRITVFELAERLNHQVEINGGILSEECREQIERLRN